jgi:hypothetical protein
MKIPKLLNINCQEATMLGSKKFETNLTLMENFKLKSHYAICKPCEYFTKQVQIIHSSLKNVKNDTTISLSDETKKSLQEKINQINNSM